LRPLNQKIKLVIVLLIFGISISLNFLTFIQAYPETQKIDQGCCTPIGTKLAKDFSAFYFGAWNLAHDPSQIYVKGSSVNASSLGISPHPESYKYLPSFLILILPFLTLSYSNALLAFDILQFCMLFLIAFVLYQLLSRKNIAIIGIVSIIALLLPFSTTQGWGISEAYFWQWAEGQDKVLDLLLILLSFFFGMKKQQLFSGLFFGLAFFDPRFFLVAVPLFVTLNKEKGILVRSSLITLIVVIVGNVPILAYPGVLSGFTQIIATSGATTPIYYYSYIPLLTVLALSIANWRDIARTFSWSSLRKSSISNPKLGIASEKS
jgi:hypothetical protein